MTAPEHSSSSRELQDAVARCAGREIWIIGDLMLDEYVHGEVSRISPEAPVQVVRVNAVETRLGGAANVARQVAALGAHAVLGGVVGQDEAGDRIVANCASIGIDTRAVCLETSRKTTRKLRVLGQGQQLIRLDWEDTLSCSESIASVLLHRLQDGPAPDVIILSDYAKGVLTDQLLERVMRFAREHGHPVIVDPKRRDLGAYGGASLLTPNLGELSRAVDHPLDPDDHDAISAAARRCVVAAELGAMVVTLGDRGMLLVAAEGPAVHAPAVRRAVSDVTGAGDTAVGVMASLIAAGSTTRQAMEVANVAAGLAVAEVGAVAIEPGQILHALDGLRGRKIIGRKELAERAAGWRSGGKRLVFTNGCFDLLHAGHVALLQQAADLGDVLILAINSDASVRRLKGSDRPIVAEHERAALLAALSCVDVVTIYDEDTPLEVLRAVRPHVLAKGQDYRIDEVVGREIVEADGGRVALIPLLAEKSTSAIVERIRRSGLTTEVSK